MFFFFCLVFIFFPFLSKKGSSIFFFFWLKRETPFISYNANVKELQDTAGSEYFKFLSRKAHEGASNQAKVDVANARMIGEIGEAEKRGTARQEISKIDAQTAVLETQRKSEKAEADAR